MISLFKILKEIEINLQVKLIVGKEYIIDANKNIFHYKFIGEQDDAYIFEIYGYAKYFGKTFIDTLNKQGKIKLSKNQKK